MVRSACWNGLVDIVLRKYRDPKLFSDFNTLAFASVMGTVLFVLLLVFMTIPVDYHDRPSVDLPHAHHLVSMPGALREDAILISVTRDGKVYFRRDQIAAADLRQKIAEHLKDGTVERKVYIVADMRARWGEINTILDGVRYAGILRVAFLADQHRS
jgi:biopolymer transport protein TolR